MQRVWNTRHPVEVRAKRYHVTLVELQWWPPYFSVGPVGPCRSSPVYRLCVLLDTLNGPVRRPFDVSGGALAIVRGIVEDGTPAGVLGDYLEDHPQEAFIVCDAILLAAARWIAANGVRLVQMWPRQGQEGGAA